MNPTDQKIRVLIVDDSKVMRSMLAWILDSSPRIEVVGFASDGQEAIERVDALKPDVVTMDIHMPVMDGYEATRRIMQTEPLPIVIVSVSCIPSDVAHVFEALEVGAVAAMEKPPGPGDPAHRELADKLIDTVIAMSEVRVIRRWHPAHHTSTPVITPPAAGHGPNNLQLLALGASTGGPPALFEVLAGLPKPCPVPIAIVQHISAGFVNGLAEWLSTSGIPTQIACQGQVLMPGHAYIAPDGYQMKIDAQLRVICTGDPPEHGLRPSVSYFFRSVATHCGPRALGVLLTGMGTDGADSLKLMRDAGALTFAQDEESSVVHGMPGEAIRLNAATYISNPQGISAHLHAILTHHNDPAPLP